MASQQRVLRFGDRLPLRLAVFFFVWLGAMLGQAANAFAQFNTPALDGVISAGEYGTHTEGNNQQTNGGTTWFMTWDATNLYIGISGANVLEAAVIYVDGNPIAPINGGTNSDGTLIGQSYDNTNFAALQFRADHVSLFKDGYREHRTANGANGWSSATTFSGSYWSNGSNVREYAIPWSNISGSMPASFNWFGYVTSSGGFVYGEMPTENGEGFIGTSARESRYFTVSTTTNGASTKPFSRNSYVFNSTSDISGFGAIGVFDFTMNSTGRQIFRATDASTWTIGGNLRVDAGTIHFDNNTGAATVSGNVVISSGATLNLGNVIGGDINVASNWTNNGTFNANSRTVTFNGSGTQTVSGSSTTNFGFVTVNQSSSAGIAEMLSPITMTSDGLTLTQGTFKLSSASTITPFSGATTIPANAGFHLNHASAVSNWGSSGSLTLDGTLTIDNGTMNVGSASGNQLTVGSSTSKATINGGTLNLPGRIQVVSSGVGNGLFINGGEVVATTVGNGSGSIANFAMNSTGRFTMTGGIVTIQRANSGGGWDVEMINAANKSLTGGEFRFGNASTPVGSAMTLLSQVPLYNLTINNAAGVTLQNDATINNTLNFITGNLNTGTLNAIIGSSGSITRTSGHVVGKLRKSFAVGTNVARSFEIGTGVDYTPVDITIANVSGAGTMTLNAAAGDHGSIGLSLLNASKSVNRRWSVSAIGLSISTYSATFNFVSSDLDAGVNTNALVVGQFSGGWSYPTVGTRTATSTQATGIGTFGDFQLAEYATPPGVTIVESSGSTDVTEGGATDSYTLVLNTQPSADVTIAFNTGAQLQAISSVTFTSSNWNTPQAITVTANDDNVVEGNHSGTITHSATSSDANYNGITIASVTANITDNDIADVTIVESSGSTDVTEGGATDSYTLALNTQPSADVTIAFNTGAQLQAITSITFTSANWNTPQTITVTANDDNAVEGNHSGTITHSATSSDANYNGITIASVTANITDNDIAGVTISESSGSTDVTEGGATDSYTIVLNTQPSADVTIAFNTGTQVQAISSITFTASNWNTPQTITVTANDDNAVEGSHTGTIMHSATSSDANYNGITVADVTANITDNDIAGVTIVESSGSTDVTEGGATDSYTIVLDTQPSSNVTIAFNTGAQLQAISSVTFTSANWNTPQTITVTANDDNAVEGSHTATITHSATSSDANYNGITIASVTANITDNDIAGVTIVESSGSTDVTEGGATDSYTIVLNTQPSADVTIAFNTNAQVQAITSITFTSANWNTPQTITVTANDDNAVEGNHSGTITHSATSSDANYNGITIASVTANITDNDIAGVTISESSGSTDVTEGGATDSYTIVLNTQPSADVTIAFNTGAQLQAISSVTFTSSNWNTPQTITVTANDDNAVEGAHTGTITHSATSSDANYNGITIADVTANITDNDIAGVTIVESSGSTHVTEGGATDSYTIVLDTQPSADVTIAFNTGTQVQTISSITFTSSNWNTPQTITVSANDDNAVEGSHTGTITHSATSSDANYNGITIASVTANITDNDIAGVTISESSGSTDVTEGGATDSYTIVLNTQPSADVTIAFNTGAQLQAITSITFTSANWNTPQTITVTANDDNAVEGSHTGTITHSATSSDANYNGITIASVTANITDNDAPPPISGRVFLANKITLKRSKQSTSSGDLHANGALTIEKGDPSTYNSNLTAVGKITIQKDNTINGNVKSPLPVSNSGTVNGAITVGAVANEPLPSDSYTAGGLNKTVPSGGSLALAPGSYGIVTLNNGGTLKLTSGEYRMNELRYPSGAENGVIEIDLSSGNPVAIKVVSNFQFGQESVVRLLPNGENDSELVTFFTLQNTALTLGRETYLLGNFNAPNAKVTLAKNSQLRGAINANEILVERDCLFLHHDSPGSLPGPGNLPKSSSDDDEEVISDQLSVISDYALKQNYPNPFNPTTVISFQLPVTSDVTLSIFNTNGQLVKKLVTGAMNAGQHNLTWDATNERGERVASGVYLYVIKAGEFTAQRKLVLMK